MFPIPVPLSGRPRERGADQTALLLNGEIKSRRDYTFTYAGPCLGAVIKGNYKRHMISPDPVGEASAFLRRSTSCRVILAKRGQF